MGCRRCTPVASRRFPSGVASGWCYRRARAVSPEVATDVATVTRPPADHRPPADWTRQPHLCRVHELRRDAADCPPGMTRSPAPDSARPMRRNARRPRAPHPRRVPLLGQCFQSGAATGVPSTNPAHRPTQRCPPPPTSAWHVWINQAAVFGSGRSLQPLSCPGNGRPLVPPPDVAIPRDAAAASLIRLSGASSPGGRNSR